VALPEPSHDSKSLADTGVLKYPENMINGHVIVVQASPGYNEMNPRSCDSGRSSAADFTSSKPGAFGLSTPCTHKSKWLKLCADWRRSARAQSSKSTSVRSLWCARVSRYGGKTGCSRDRLRPPCTEWEVQRFLCLQQKSSQLRIQYTYAAEI
jgi:hypothetical protein